MDRRGAGLSPAEAPGRALRRVAAALLVAVGGVIGAAAPSQAGPMAPFADGFSARRLEMVRDYCGHGFHRENKQRNKAGAWVGKCVPNKPKKQQPVDQPANPPPNRPG
jgi:hypothetical protein